MIYATNNYSCPNVHALSMSAPCVHHEVAMCYDLKLKGLSNKTTLVLSNTRELDRVPSTK